jgi:hypothetical protein
VKKPADNPLKGDVKLRVHHAGFPEHATLFDNPYAAGAGLSNNVTLRDADFTAGDVTLWLQADGPSGSLQDILFEMRYDGASDRAKATAVWADFKDIRATGASQSAIQVPAGGAPLPRYLQLVKRELDQIYPNPFGVENAPYNRANKTWITNPIEFHFQAKPAGINLVSHVK